MRIYDTTTVRQLANAFAEGRVSNDATVRLRTATIALLPLGRIAKSDYIQERFDISLRKFRGFPSGAVYPPVRGDALIDVTGAQLHDNEKYEDRGWRDMHLSDLDKPCEKGDEQ